MFFSDKDLSFLEGSQLPRFVKEARWKIEDTYEQICKSLPEYKDLASLEEFKKAVILIRSRLFCKDNFSINNQNFMVPLADMCNHH
jgi:hypothetical protein